MPAVAGVSWGLLAGAGPLNPPAGPVAATGKTLGEVEPRIAVTAANTPGDADSVFRITQPGSYYLTGNVAGVAGSHGIQIETEGVTLDLNGFALVGVAGSLDGVNMPNFRENVVIRNGHIRGWGESGIEARIDIGRIEDITAADNGAWGIDNAASGTFTTRIISCEVLTNGAAFEGGAGGIRGGQVSHITDCTAYNNTGVGILVGNFGIVTGCIAQSNTSHGIVASIGGTISACTASGNTSDGIRVASDCVVVGNRCYQNGSATGDGAGVHATGSDNRIEGNNCTDADRGIDVDQGGNFITRNTCSGNATNWTVAAGNVCLVVQAFGGGLIDGNAGGAAPGSTDPNANFTY